MCHLCSASSRSLTTPFRILLDILSGEARYLWAHAIPARTWDKVGTYYTSYTSTRPIYTPNPKLHTPPFQPQVKGARVPRTARRLSFTLRRVLPPLPTGGGRRPCLCPFPERCPTSPLEARAAYLASCRREDGVRACVRADYLIKCVDLPALTCVLIDQLQAVVPPEARKPTPLERSNVHAV